MSAQIDPQFDAARSLFDVLLLEESLTRTGVSTNYPVSLSDIQQLLESLGVFVGCSNCTTITNLGFVETSTTTTTTRTSSAFDPFAGMKAVPAAWQYVPPTSYGGAVIAAFAYWPYLVISGIAAVAIFLLADFDLKNDKRWALALSPIVMLTIATVYSAFFMVGTVYEKFAATLAWLIVLAPLIALSGLATYLNTPVSTEEE